MRVFVDSNIPMYVAGAEHPNRDPATRFLESAGEAGLDLCTSSEVLQEILFRWLSGCTISSSRSYRRSSA